MCQRACDQRMSCSARECRVKVTRAMRPSAARNVVRSRSRPALRNRTRSPCPHGGSDLSSIDKAKKQSGSSDIFLTDLFLTHLIMPRGIFFPCWMCVHSSRQLPRFEESAPSSLHFHPMEISPYLEPVIVRDGSCKTDLSEYYFVHSFCMTVGMGCLYARLLIQFYSCHFGQTSDTKITAGERRIF